MEKRITFGKLSKMSSVYGQFISRLCILPTTDCLNSTMALLWPTQYANIRSLLREDDCSLQLKYFFRYW